MAPLAPDTHPTPTPPTPCSAAATEPDQSLQRLANPVRQSGSAAGFIFSDSVSGREQKQVSRSAETTSSPATAPAEAGRLIG